MANEFKVKKGLIVDGSNTVLDIQGTQGQLFSVTDSLVGDLFSVSDVSGIPIFNVNSSGLSTFSGDVKIQKNTPLLELGISNTSTGNSKLTFFSKNNSTANAYSIQFNKDTNIDRLEFIDGSGNANIKF